MNNVEVPVFVDTNEKYIRVGLQLHIKYLLNIPEIKEYVTEKLYQKAKEDLNAFTLNTRVWTFETPLQIDFDIKFIENIISAICNDDTSGLTEKQLDVIGSPKETYDIKVRGRLLNYTFDYISSERKSTLEYVISYIYNYMGVNKYTAVIDGYEKYSIVLDIVKDLGCIKNKLFIPKECVEYFDLVSKNSTLINLKLQKIDNEED